MQRTSTRLQRAIERHLGQPLAELVAERRAAAAGWRTIAEEVQERTAIEVSHESLRAWFDTDGAGAQ